MTQRRLGLTLLLETGLRPMVPRLRALLFSTTSATVLLMFASPALAQQLPSGGSVAAGSAAIVRPNASTLNINQGSDRAIINWQSFSVGTGGTVNFNQPGASSATLNRVNGAAPSSIAGTINAPGTVLLVNPNGIAITRTGTINTGSFAASTLNIKDADFLAGNYKFDGSGGSAGVVNNGRINVSDGGFVALLGGQVANNGIISARLGKVGLGAGEQATLDLAGDGFLSVAVPSSEIGKLVKPNRALVSNKGRIEADGGVVYLSAATAQNVLRNAVNIPGTVRTNTVGSRGGRIIINGGAGGTIRVSGRLIANGRSGAHAGSVSVKGTKIDLSGVISARGAKGGAVAVAATETLKATGKIDVTATAGKGGTIDLTAANVTVVGALIDASGSSGGGTIQIGGGLQGGGALTHALNVSIDSTSTIRADALDNGHGGTVTVWSDGSTAAYGTFSARGGANGGNGGMIETSGAVLSINGIRVDTSAAYGATGNWLLDPTDLTVDAAAAATISTNLGSNNVTLLTTDTTATGPGNQSAGLGDININSAIAWTSANTLTLTAYHGVNVNAQINAGNSGKIVMQTTNGGDIVINAAISGSSNSITLNSSRDIALNSALAGTGAITLTATNNITFHNTVTGTNNFTLKAGGTITSGYAFSAGNFALDGTWSQIGASLPSFSATGMTFTSGAFIRALGGDGTSATPYQLTDVYGLQGIASPLLLSKNFVLANDIDASVTATWNAGSGFKPIGNGDAIFTQGAGRLGGGPGTPFSGIFDGQFHVIYNPTISGGHDVGVFGSNSGTIKSVGVSGGSVVGATYVGGLVGYNSGTISQSFAQTSVGGAGGVGGLVGRNDSTVSESYASSLVYATGSIFNFGGFSGMNFGTIRDSYSNGPVYGAGQVGGFTGINGGALINIYTNSRFAGGASIPGSGVGVLNGSIATFQGGTLQNIYFNSDMTGASYAFYSGNALGARNTAQMMSGLPSGFSGSVWGIVAGQSYPYLLWQFPAGTTPQVISGRVYSDLGTSLAAGVRVGAGADGMSFVGMTYTGANGTYNLLVPQGSIGAASQLIVYTPYTSGGGASLQSASGSIAANDIYLGYLKWTTTGTTITGAEAALAQAVGNNAAMSSYLATVSGRAYVSTNPGTFTVDQALNAAGPLAIIAGNISILSDINWTSGPLSLLATGTVTVNGLLTGNGQGAGGIIKGTSIASSSSIYWTSGSMNLQATSGSVTIAGNLAGFGPNAALTATGTSVRIDGSVAWANGALALQASNGAVTVGGNVLGSGGNATVTGRSISIGGTLTWSNGTLTLTASNGNVTVTGDVIGGGAGASGGTISGQTVSLGSLTWANSTMTTTATSALAIHGNVNGMNVDGNNNNNWTLSAPTVTVDGAVGVNTFQFNSGNWVQNTTGLMAFYAKYFNLASGVTFQRFAGGDGTTTTPYQITDIYGLQGIATMSSLWGRSFALANDIQAGITAIWNGGAGFMPIGNSTTPFSGQFLGQNRSINGLTIYRPTTDYVGLFGATKATASQIQDLHLTNVSITGRDNVGGIYGIGGKNLQNDTVSGMIAGNNNVGGIVGYLTSSGVYGGPAFAAIGRASFSGTVTGAGNVGGVVGTSESLVINSFSSGTVTGSLDSVGGLVGWSKPIAGGGGYVITSGSIANVNGRDYVGGLVGLNGDPSTIIATTGSDIGLQNFYRPGGAITSSFASGAVVSAGGSSNGGAGGLVGYSSGIISDSYSTGSVIARGMYTYTGGLVGYALNAITRSWSSATVLATGPSSMAGGLVGVLGSDNPGRVISTNGVDGNAGFVLANLSYAYATGSVRGNIQGGLVGGLSGPASINNTYNTTTMYMDGAGINRGAVVGLMLYANTLATNNNNYWDADVNGEGKVNGGTVPFTVSSSNTTPAATLLSHAQALTQSSYANWDFSNVWYMAPGAYPVLRSAGSHAVIVVGNNTTQTYGDTPAGGPSATFYGLRSYDDSSINGLNIVFKNSTVNQNDPFGSIVTKTSADGTEYQFIFVPGAITTTPKSIVVQGGDLSRVYGDSNPTGTSSVVAGGLANGDQIGYVGVSNGPTGANNSHNHGADADAGYSYAYTTSSALFTYGSALNYNVTYANGSIAVTPRAVTIALKGTTQKTYDGTTTAALTSSNFTISGAYPWGTEFSALAANGANTGTYGSQNAGANKLVTVTGVSLTATGDPAIAGNYYLTSDTASGNIGTITPKALSGTVNIGGINKTYDGTADAGSGSTQLSNGVNGLVGSDSATLTISSGTYDSANAGSRSVSGLSGLSLNNGNYTIDSLVVTGTGTISPKNLSGTTVIGGIDKTYDGSTTAGAGSQVLSGAAYGLVGGDTVTLSALSGLYNSANAGARTVSGLSGLAIDNGNYRIGSLTATGTGTISPKDLYGTAIISDIDKVYDGTTAAGAGSMLLSGAAFGFVGNDTATLSALSGVYDRANAGARTISALTGLTLNNGNYRIGSLIIAGSGVISPAQVIVTASGGSSVYGYSPANPKFTASGLKNGETPDVLTGLANSFAIDQYSNAQNYTLTIVGTLTNSNYTVTNTLPGSWTVTPAPIVVTATSGTSVYGQLPTNPGLTATGLQNGQGVGVLTGLSSNFSVTNLSDVDSYTLRVTGALTNHNYAIVNDSTDRIAGTWTVTPAPVVVTATGGTSIYGQSPSNPGFTATGLQNGQDVSFLYGLSNNFGINNLTNAGNYTVNVTGTLTNRNYAIVNSADRVAGTWTVNPAQIVVTATGGSSVYGQSPANPGFTATGLQNGQDETILTGLVNGFGIDRFSNAGDHTLNVTGTLTNGNYAISSRIAGIWNVNPASLTITAIDQSKIYGDEHLFTGTEFSSIGLKNNESIGLVALASAGKAALAGVAGGPYAIVPNNATGGTFDIANYAVTYVNGALTVRPADIFVGALGGTSVYGSSPLNPGLSATGLKNGETVTVLAGLSNSFGITNLSNAGNHVLSVAGLLTNPNYKITGTTTATWAITQAQLMYVATPAQRYFGDANPDFTGAVTGFVNGDTLASATGGKLQFTTDAKQNTIIGAYAIDGSGLTAANYLFVQAPSNATALTISTPPTIPGSQFGPPNSNAGSSSGNVNVSFQLAPAAATQPISVTTTPRVVASNTTPDIAPASLPDKNGAAADRSYEPISIFDPNQYSQFKLPDYAGQASEAAIFTMIGRFALPDQAATLMIDTFWNGKAPDLHGVSGRNPLDGKVSFSSSAPIEAGKTNIAKMLRDGAVMIGGGPGQWLLATGLSPDGKSVLANDPVSGKVVALLLDSTTGAIGSFAGFYDAKLRGISSTANLAITTPAGGAIDGIKDFVPSTFVTVKIQ